MKLTENTISVLKNFATINESLLINSGTQQRTMNIDRTILAEFTASDDFPLQFGIYDLPQFLANISLLENPDVDYGDSSLVMTNDMRSLSFNYCSPTHIKSPPNKTLKIENPDVEFDLSSENFQFLLKLAATNNLPNVTVANDGNQLIIKTYERSNDSSNVGMIRLGDYEGKDFSATFNVNNFKMNVNDYHVKVNLEGFALFETKDQTLRYFIALDK